MIRKLFPLILVAGLTACASSGNQNVSSDTAASQSVSSAPSSGAGSSECNAEPVQRYVDQKYSSSIDANLRSTSSSSQMRVLRPGQVMTLEYNPSRLNVIVEDGDVISALRCG